MSGCQAERGRPTLHTTRDEATPKTWVELVSGVAWAGSSNSPQPTKRAGPESRSAFRVRPRAVEIGPAGSSVSRAASALSRRSPSEIR